MKKICYRCRMHQGQERHWCIRLWFVTPNKVGGRCECPCGLRQKRKQH